MQKIAIVTGASRGIGKECAKILARNGIKVIANYNKSEKEAQKLKENIDIDIYKANVAEKAEIKNMVQDVLKKYGHIDILVNNAGISQIKLFTDITDEDWQNMIQTNLSSAFYMTREVLPNMIHNKSGCIINIASVWGLVRRSLRSALFSSKSRDNWYDKGISKRSRPFEYKSKCNCTRSY